MKNKKNNEKKKQGWYEFECWHENECGEKWAKQTYIAETPGKAKFAHYEYLQDGIWEDDFFTIVKNMKCRKIGKASICSFFGDYKQFERIKKARSIEFAFQGMRISIRGKMGTIVGGNNSLNLDVVMDDNWYISNCHPWWETVYYDDNGHIVADYREKISCK